jgi:hypothetical protein
VKVLHVAVAALFMMPLAASPARAQAADPRIAEARQAAARGSQGRRDSRRVRQDDGRPPGAPSGHERDRVPAEGGGRFVRCYNKILAPRRDMEAKLRAEKKSDKEVTDAIAAATKAGTLKAPQFGRCRTAIRTIRSGSSCCG